MRLFYLKTWLVSNPLNFRVVLILMNFDILSPDEDNGESAVDSDSEYSSAVETQHQRVNNENLEPKKSSSPVQQQVAKQNGGINSSKFFKPDTYKQPVNKGQPTVFAATANNSVMNTSTAGAGSAKLCTITSLNPYQNKYFGFWLWLECDTWCIFSSALAGG